MAEGESDSEPERLGEELDLLQVRQPECKSYCSGFCELVTEHTGRWRVPLPRLQVLRTALCCFCRSSASFPAGCEPVHCTLSSLALSFFELLLFFDKEEFLESPLRDILNSFQECYSHLTRHNNIYLLLVRQIIESGGPWEHPVLQAILREAEQPQEEVEKYLSSEVPVFFELRVRYLLTCNRTQEAVALAKYCVEHPELGKHLYFHQAYLTCLWKASCYDHLQKGIALIDGRDAVEIICNCESEEKDELLLALSKAFLTHQLSNGDMYYLWDLIFIWSKLHLRANPSKKDFLEECLQLIFSATNIRSIFPFMKIIRAELGNEGLHFCVELCARALQMDLHEDPTTTCLIYKTIVYLLPNDLEICRACALLVFFQERTVESYKIVYLLYTHPDQEYHVDSSAIKNHIRVEILQILKKGLFFDPEFWSLITLRTNCLKLMSEKVMKAALKEIMEEDKWIPNYCVKEPHKLHYDSSELYTRKVIQQPVKNKNKLVMRRIVVPPEVTSVSRVKRRGRKPGSRVIKVIDDPQRRCSYRPLDITQENLVKPHDSSYLTRSAGRNATKRRGRKPHWLQEESVEEAQNSAPNPVQCLDDETESPSMQTKVLENTTVKMDRGQEISQVQTDTQATCLSVAEITCEAVQEIMLETMLLPDDPSVSCGHGVMVEVSLPDNVVSDAHSREQGHQVLEPTSASEPDFSMEVSSRSEEFPVKPLEELQPTSTSQPDSSMAVSLREEKVADKSLEVLQATTTSQPGSILEVPAKEEISFREPAEHYEKEGNSAVEPRDDLKSSASSCADKPNTFLKVAVDVNNATIFQLHNYCKIPEGAVEDYSEVTSDAPATLPCNLPECFPECTGCPLEVLAENNTLRGCTLPEKEVFLQKPPEATVDSFCDAGIAKPESTAEVFVEAGTFTQGDIVGLETVEAVVEEIVTDSVFAAPDDTLQIHDSEKDISSSHSFVPHITAGASDNTENTLVSDDINHIQINERAVCNKTAVESNATHVSTDTQRSLIGLEQKQVQTYTLEKTKETRLETELEAPLVDGCVKAENLVISHYCKLCNKNFRGGNIILHAVAHLQKDKLKCMFCGKLFNRRLIAKKHVLEHIEKLKITSALGNGLCEALTYTEQSPPNDKHKNKSATRIPCRISTRQRNVDKELAGPKVSRQISSSRKKKPTTNRQHRISLRRRKVGKVQRDQKMQGKHSNARKARSVDNRKVMNENESGEPRHHCPAGGCTKTSFRNESSLLRHAMKLHPVDLKVLEYIFRKRNGKCQFCQREFKSLEHFQHHVKRHEHPLKHACYHFDCIVRFKTRAELRDHMKRHRPLQVQCDFAGCSQRFCHLARLHHHEQKHYLPPPDDHSAGDRNIQIEEQKRLANVSESGCESLNRSVERHASCTAGNSITNLSEEIVSPGMSAAEKHDDVHVDRTVSNKQLVNGHAKNGDWVDVISTQSPLKGTCPQGQRDGETQADNNVNTDSNGKPECTTPGQKKETPRTTPSYGRTPNKPFVRPPPTAYLDERHTSMPKRRKSSDVHPPSCEEESSPGRSTQRQRCTNCFSSFPSVEALQSHLSSSKCKSLFGFDSDDESAW